MLCAVCCGMTIERWVGEGAGEGWVHACMRLGGCFAFLNFRGLVSLGEVLGNEDGAGRLQVWLGVWFEGRG